MSENESARFYEKKKPYNVHLIFPPQGDPTMPSQSLACLVAYIRRELPEIRISLTDANVEAYNFLLQNEHLSHLVKHVEEKRKMLEKNWHKTPQLREFYKALCRAEISASHVASTIETAKQIIRNEALFYQPSKYRFASSILCKALNLISTAYYPANIEIGSFSSPYSTDHLQDLIDATQDETTNPFANYYKKSLLPMLEVDTPDVLGFSLSYPTQFHQVLYLARKVHNLFPYVRIVVGGSMIPFLLDGLTDAALLFDWIDTFISFEGESALVQLISTWLRNESIIQIPGVICRKNGMVHNCPPRVPENLDLLPTPDYDDFPLSLYLSPKLVLPYSLGRGCSWASCTFCCQDLVSSRLPRQKSKVTIRRELRQLRERYDCTMFYMSDEGHSPEKLIELGRIIQEDNLAIRWTSDARLEGGWTQKKLNQVAEGGCVKLWFGLESYNQTTLNRIGKGIDILDVKPILEFCKKADILTHLYCLFSFPGETLEEALTTLNFIIKNQDLIDTVAINYFRLHTATPIFKCPQKFNVQILDSEKTKIFSYDHPYETTKGMSAQEAVSLCTAINEHPQIQYLLAPHILSKAHILLLAVKDSNYRQSIIQATKAKTNVTIQSNADQDVNHILSNIYRVSPKVTIRRYPTQLFENISSSDNREEETTLFAYISTHDRLVSLSGNLALIINFIIEEKCVLDILNLNHNISSTILRNQILYLIQQEIIEKI